MGRNINIAFLWHMHQPPYEEPGAGVFLLPWTWLHATKDYYDMGEVIRRHPKIRVNMNFTPVLLYQLDQYARELIPDQMMLVMAKDPERLTLADREFLLRTCFCVNLDTMAAPFPRYRQLHDMFRAWGDPAEAAANFRPEDYQDLSVLFLLAWCGPTLQAHPDIVELTKKALAENVAPKDVLEKGLIAGMGVVGKRFKANEVYVPEVLIAARAMKGAMEVLQPALTKAGVQPLATVVLGTVKGDLHDIGKNLVGMMLTGGGLKVVDIGTDVPAEKFVEACKTSGAKVCAMSALLTTTMPQMKDVIKALKASGVAVKTIIGGAPVTQSYADEIGADGYAPDAASAVDSAKALL